MKKTFLTSIYFFLILNIFAQETKLCLFIGTYEKTKRGICGDYELVHEEVADHAEYVIKRIAFEKEHKNQWPSTKFISSKECVIAYQYMKKVSGWNCNSTVIATRTSKSLEECQKRMDESVAKYPNDYLTHPNPIFSWEGKNNIAVVSIKPNCPTFSFKFSNNGPSYNCVSLEWWSLSTTTNIVTPSGDFKQTTDPQPNYFTIEFRKQGDIYWITDKRENNGKNTHTINGLNACTTYEVRLIATCNNNQSSEPTNIVRFTTACKKPGSITVENITNNSAKINNQRLTVPVTFPCASSASTQIRIIEYKTNSSSWQEVICNSGSPCFLNALSPGTMYRVRARFKYGHNLYSNYTNEISFTTKN